MTPTEHAAKQEAYAEERRRKTLTLKLNDDKEDEIVPPDPPCLE